LGEPPRLRRAVGLFAPSPSRALPARWFRCYPSRLHGGSTAAKNTKINLKSTRERSNPLPHYQLNIKMKKIILPALLFFFAIVFIATFFFDNSSSEKFISYQVDLKKQSLKLYWKDDNQQIIGGLKKLKNWLESQNQELIFATNAGMYKADQSPVGLFIENQRVINDLDKTQGDGNFYLQPNGVFFTTLENQAVICKTADFVANKNIKYATQSGPMLVIDGKINTSFKKGSANLNIRNGVGILANGKLIFAMSNFKINFYDFADYFIKQGCKNALYLDGFVSQTYLPEKNWVQTGGDFGVIIGVTKK
jgi:uncharacterized protein YigE (DUF2233 family)